MKPTREREENPSREPDDKLTSQRYRFKDKDIGSVYRELLKGEKRWTTTRS